MKRKWLRRGVTVGMVLLTLAGLFMFYLGLYFTEGPGKTSRNAFEDLLTLLIWWGIGIFVSFGCFVFWTDRYGRWVVKRKKKAGQPVSVADKEFAWVKPLVIGMIILIPLGMVGICSPEITHRAVGAIFLVLGCFGGFFGVCLAMGTINPHY
jgi:hypothetical protein